jgi:outer membrane protein
MFRNYFNRQNQSQIKWNQSLFIVFFLLIAPFITQAQNQWTLEKCINYALAHNLDVQLNQLQLEIQENNLLRSKAAMLPSLNANANDNINWGKTVDRYTNQFADAQTTSINLYLQSTVTIFDGFRLLNTVRQNKLELAAQQLDLKYQKDMKAMEIATAFLQILYDKENKQSVGNQLKITEMQLERTQLLVDAGSAAKGDLYNIKAQFASEQSQFILAENKLNISILNLKQMMYLPGDTAFEIYAPEIDLQGELLQISDPYQVYNYAIDHRPEIQSAEYRLQSAQKGLSIAKGGLSPSLSLSAGIGTGYSGANTIIDGTPMFTGFTPTGDFTTAGDTVITALFDYKTKPKAWSDQFSDNNNYSIGISLSIPIFNGLQNYTNISQSKIAVQQSEIQLEKQRWSLQQIIEQSYADARSALKQYEATLIQKEALQESFKYAEERYAAKMITAFEYNDAKTKLSTAQGDLLNAKYNYVFRVKVLDFYFGKPLSL